MSFEFAWPSSFPASFYESAKTAFEQALNAGQKLSLVSDRIRVEDLNLGTIPPELDIISLEELSVVNGSFKGSFMLSYSGDASISLATNLHVNPLTQYKHALEMLATPSVLLTTAEMFVQLKLSGLRLRCVISVSFSKASGLTLAFKDDPLESLNVSSSFDSFGVVQQFIQSEIENQLRERFRRDLPSLIHRLSQRWCADMAQQSTATYTPVVVEQGPNISVHSGNTLEEREPDDSLPYDYDRYEAALTAAHDPPSNPASPTKTLRDESRPAPTSPHSMLRYTSWQQEVGMQDGGQQPPQSPSDSFTRHRRESTNQSVDLSSHSYNIDIPGMSSQADDSSRPSSWSSSWSASPRSPPVMDARPDSNPNSPPIRHRHMSGTDSPILSSLRRSNTNFATTFSRPAAGLSHLSADLNALEESGQAGQNSASDGRVRQATRKRFHRLEGKTPKSSPHNSPHKSRTLKEARSRDRLRVKAEELDEYFPITSDGEGHSSSSTAKGAAVAHFGQERVQRPSLLNPDVPVQIPAHSSLLHSGRPEFPTKNSLRRTMMSSRLRDGQRSAGVPSNVKSSRRLPMDNHFFDKNVYS